MHNCGKIQVSKSGNRKILNWTIICHAWYMLLFFLSNCMDLENERVRAFTGNEWTERRTASPIGRNWHRDFVKHIAILTKHQGVSNTVRNVVDPGTLNRAEQYVLRELATTKEMQPIISLYNEFLATKAVIQLDMRLQKFGIRDGLTRKYALLKLHF